MNQNIKVSGILKETKCLLSSPNAWIKNSAAQDKNGKPTYPFSADAVCWCISGALDKAAAFETSGYQKARDILESLINQPIPMWNDTRGRTHKEVLELLDQAIKLAENESY